MKRNHIITKASWIRGHEPLGAFGHAALQPPLEQPILQSLVLILVYDSILPLP
jgi:hypothetical protein